MPTIGAPVAQLTPGQYKGAWAPNTSYNINDIVDYLGTKYYASTAIHPTVLAPFLVASAHGTGSTGAGLTFTIPTGSIAGDTLILSVMSSAALTFTTRPTGWFQLYRGITATTVTYMMVVTHVVSPAEISLGTLSIGFTSVAACSWDMQSWRNVVATDATANGKSSTNVGASGTSLAVLEATAITSTTGTMLAIFSAFYNSIGVNAITYSPAVTASDGTSTQFDSHSAYVPIVAGAVPAQTVTSTWASTGTSAGQMYMVPLIGATPFSVQGWVLYEKLVPHFRGTSVVGETVNTNIVFIVNSDAYAQGQPLLGWDSVINGWVVPVSGVYLINWTQSRGSQISTTMNVMVNGVATYSSINVAASGWQGVIVAAQLYQGDVISFQVNATTTPTNTILTMTRLGPWLSGA